MYKIHYIGGFIVKNVSSKHEDLAIKKYLNPVLSGLGFGLAVSLIFLVLFSVIISSASVSQSTITVMSFISMILGSFVGGFKTARLLKQNGLVMGIITGVCLFLVMLVLSLFFVREQISILILVKGFVVLLCSGLGGILGVNYRRRR